MKILMLTDKMDCGGAETHVFTLATALVKRGNTVVVASSGGILADKLEREGVGHICLPLSKKTPEAIFLTYRALCSFVMREKFDIIHSHARLPSFIASRVAKKTQVCHVVTAHARFSLRGFRSHLSRWGDFTLAVSEDLKQYLIDSYALAPENITVIPNGIDCSLFCPPKEKCRLHANKKNGVRIAFLSRLDSDCSMGAELLCRIAKGLCDSYGEVDIVIGGQGSEYEGLKKLAAKANREIGYRCVRLMGQIHDVPRFLQSADIFVGVSRAAMEASLCGLSVILCGNEGFFGVLTEDNFSLAQKSNFCARGLGAMSEDKLYSSIEDILKKGKDEARRDAAKVRERMLTLCDAHKMSTRTERFYREALSTFYDSQGKDKPRILLCGYYGFGNVGDDALLRMAVKRARAEFKDCEIRALTRRGRRDSHRFCLPCARRKSPLSLLFEMARSDFLIFGGGTLLQEYTSRRSLIYYVSLLKVAKLFGVKCYIWGNGIGELSGRLSRCLVRSALCECEFVGLRDRRSLDTANALLRDLKKGKKPLIALEEDLTQGYIQCSRERAEYLTFLLFGSGALPSFITVAVKENGGRALDELKTELDTAVEEGNTLVFAVMCEREDGEISERLCEEYGGKLLRGVCFSDLVGVMRYSNGVYSMRLHALVAASMAGVCFKGFGEDRKIKAFCEEKQKKTGDV